MTNEFDVVVIGGGPAGENAAAYARDNGLEVALVERELVGGECSYWACMPSKALLRPGEALAASRRVPGAARAVTGELDVDAMLRSRDAFSSNWDDRHQVDWVESTGTSLIRGHARLAGEQTVEVEVESGDSDDQLRVIGVDGGWLYAVGDVAGGALLGNGVSGTAHLVVDTAAPHHARRDLHRPGRGRDARRRDHRDRVRHHPRPTLAHRPAVPDGQRGLAAAPRDRPRHGVMRDTAAAQRGGER